MVHTRANNLNFPVCWPVTAAVKTSTITTGIHPPPEGAGLRSRLHWQAGRRSIATYQTLPWDMCADPHSGSES
jgi:hypothetical protein